jgi:hypothetical protein
MAVVVFEIVGWSANAGTEIVFVRTEARAGLLLDPEGISTHTWVPFFSHSFVNLIIRPQLSVIVLMAWLNPGRSGCS